MRACHPQTRHPCHVHVTSGAEKKDESSRRMTQCLIVTDRKVECVCHTKEINPSIRLSLSLHTFCASSHTVPLNPLLPLQMYSFYLLLCHESKVHFIVKNSPFVLWTGEPVSLSNRSLFVCVRGWTSGQTCAGPQGDSLWKCWCVFIFLCVMTLFGLCGWFPSPMRLRVLSVWNQGR